MIELRHSVVLSSVSVYKDMLMGIRSRSYADETVLSAVMGYKAGFSQRAISRIIAVPRETVREWISDYHGGRVGDGDITDHSHQWVIDRPNGPTSEGVCRICFEERAFRNSFPEGSRWKLQGKL